MVNHGANVQHRALQALMDAAGNAIDEPRPSIVAPIYGLVAVIELAAIATLSAESRRNDFIKEMQGHGPIVTAPGSGIPLT